ncbi:MAG: NAD(P)/FAD-dependent oxidoreductase [Candidatus Puniceispirillaceae bacterium]
MKAEIIIIGAGMAGLMAGRILSQAGREVLILDKGRRIGGRMASRRDSGLLFNHGAQFVTAHSPVFSALCEGASDSGIMEKWPLSGRDNGFTGRPSMRDIASFLGANLSVQQEVEIVHITHSQNSFILQSTSGEAYHCQHLLLSAPAPQTEILLRELAPKLAGVASLARYAPCWTVMAELLHLPEGLRPVIIEEGILGWASLEASRPVATPSGAVTLQANADYSERFLESPPEQVIKDVTTAYQQAQNIQTLKWGYQRAHRWRYAKVIKPVPPDAPFMESFSANMVALAGDWHPVSATPDKLASGARAEEALLSGHRAAFEILSGLAK